MDKPNRHITIKDIATALSIAPSTVSRALKDHPDISPETKKLVKKYAAKNHYRPNALASNLRTQKTKTIGILIPEIIHHFFSTVISGIEDVAYGRGYRVMICQSNEDYSREKADIQALVDNRVDGILASVSKTTENFDHFNEVIKNGTPVVFFDRVSPKVITDKVIINDAEGAFTITNHLIEKGCTDILHLAAQHRLLIGRNRLEGYMAALQKHRIPFREEYVLHCDTREDVERMKDQILKLAPKINGVFAVNDSTAIAAMLLLQKNGYHIPKDIAVTGFGDGPIATITNPTLTTIEQQGYEMGKEAVQLLLNRIEAKEGQRIAITTKELSPVLRVRESTDR